MDEIIEISSDSEFSGSDPEKKSAPPAQIPSPRLCSKHSQQSHLHLGPRNTVTEASANSSRLASEVIVISDDDDDDDAQSNSDGVELIDVDVTCRFKVAVHTCNKSKGRLQPVEVQQVHAIRPSLSPKLLHTCSKSHLSSSPRLNSPSNHQSRSSPGGLVSNLPPAVHIDLPSQHSRLSPNLPHAVHVHVCSPTKHRLASSPHTQFGTPSKTPPVAAVRPQFRSSTAQRIPRDLNTCSSNLKDAEFQTRSNPQSASVHTCSQRSINIEEVVLSSSQELLEHPSPSCHQQGHSPKTPTTSSQTRISPTKRLLSREKRNRRSSRAWQITTLSTDSDSDFEKSPSKRHFKHKKHTCSRYQKENIILGMPPYAGHSSSSDRQQHCSKSRDAIHIDKVKEPVLRNTHATMPVKSSSSEDILSGDLPTDNACDPTSPTSCKSDEIINKRSSPTAESFDQFWQPVRRKRRYKSANSSPISDSDSDDELADVVQSRDKKQADSRDDTSEEITNLFHDRGSRALQENARMRNNSHHRNVSPHRNPLQQVAQEQARVCLYKRREDFDSTTFSPKKPKLENRKIKSNEQNLKVAHQKPEKFSSEPPTLDLIPTLEPIQAKSPPKHCETETEPPYLVLSCESSDDLAPVRWSPKKSKQDESPKKKLEISKKKRDILLARSGSSAFQTLKRTHSSASTEPQKHSSTNVLRTLSGVSNTQQDAAKKTHFSNRSAFDFLHKVKESFSQSDSSDNERSSKRTADPNPTRTISEKPRVSPKITSSPSNVEELDINRKVYVACVPVHIKAPGTCNKKESETERTILTFGMLIQTLLEGCQEEGHHNDAVDFIQSFTSIHRCPSNDVMLYLLEDLLMKGSDDRVLLSNTYTTLKHVQHIHPPSRFKFLLDWRIVRTVLNYLLADGAKQRSDSEGRLRGNYLVLKYITSMLAEDLEAQDRNDSLNRSSAFNLLSPDNCFANVRNVASWICKCVMRIKEAEDIQRSDAASPPAPPAQEETCRKRLFFPSCSPLKEQSSKSPPSSETRLTILLNVLDMLQKMLHMSLVVSVNLNQSASKVADELLYSYKRLPRYEHRRQVLQTLTCHVVRLKLIELILDDYQVTGDTIDQRTLAISVGKLVEYFFKCNPSNSAGNDDDDDADDEDDDDDDMEETHKDPAEECEELVTLLLYLMQSYIWTTNGKIPDTDRLLRNRLPNLRQHSSHTANQLLPFNGKFALSMNDKEYLIMMGDFVDDLRKRLEAYCPKLTTRTKLYLLQLDAMRDIADCC